MILGTCRRCGRTVTDAAFVRRSSGTLWCPGCHEAERAEHGPTCCVREFARGGVFRGPIPSFPDLPHDLVLPRETMAGVPGSTKDVTIVVDPAKALEDGFDRVVREAIRRLHHTRGARRCEFRYVDPVATVDGPVELAVDWERAE